MTPRSTGHRQSVEQALREQVAADVGGDYLTVVARNHSLSVMDREVDRFLEARHRGHGSLMLVAVGAGIGADCAPRGRMCGS